MSDSPTPAPTELEDELFRRVKQVYSFFKVVPDVRDRKGPPEARARHRAAQALNAVLTTGRQAFARDWSEMFEDQHRRALDFLLKDYCLSRGRPDYDLSSLRYQNLREQIGFPLAVSLRQQHVLLTDLNATLAMLLDLLATLYNTPIDDREHVAFEDYRSATLAAHKAAAAARAQASAPRPTGEAQGLVVKQEARLARLVTRHEERLSAANEVRLEHLDSVKAVMAMLHQHVVPPGDLYGAPPHVAFELYLSRLDQQQQMIVVGRARNLLYRACEERACHGRALNPTDGFGEILVALHAPHLGYTLCVTHLSKIVDFYVMHGAPAGVVEHFQAALERFATPQWARLFPQLALPQQLYAVSTSGTLLLQVEAPTGEPLTAGQVAGQVALIFPTNSPQQRSWARAAAAPEPALHSLAHLERRSSARTSSQGAPPQSSSRYFPHSRSSRW